MGVWVGFSSPSRNFGVQLTLFQPIGQIMPITLLLAPLDLKSLWIISLLNDEIAIQLLDFQIFQWPWVQMNKRRGHLWKWKKKLYSPIRNCMLTNFQQKSPTYTYQFAIILFTFLLHSLKFKILLHWKQNKVAITEKCFAMLSV